MGSRGDTGGGNDRDVSGAEAVTFGGTTYSDKKRKGYREQREKISQICTAVHKKGRKEKPTRYNKKQGDDNIRDRGNKIIFKLSFLRGM